MVDAGWLRGSEMGTGVMVGLGRAAVAVVRCTAGAGSVTGGVRRGGWLLGLRGSYLGDAPVMSPFPMALTTKNHMCQLYSD